MLSSDVIIVTETLNVVVKTMGWNELLVLPMVAFDDVFSVSGHCAHNLKSPLADPNHTAPITTTSQQSLTTFQETMAEVNGWHNIGHCMSSELKKAKDITGSSSQVSNFSFHGMAGDTLRTFFVRDSSNRGPLAFRGHMMRTLGFLDEVCVCVCHYICLLIIFLFPTFLLM